MGLSTQQVHHYCYEIIAVFEANIWAYLRAAYLDASNQDTGASLEDESMMLGGLPEHGISGIYQLQGSVLVLVVETPHRGFGAWHMVTSL